MENKEKRGKVKRNREGAKEQRVGGSKEVSPSGSSSHHGEQQGQLHGLKW